MFSKSAVNIKHWDVEYFVSLLVFIIPFWVYPDPNFLLDIQFNYDQSMYGFREFFKRHGIKYSDPIWTCWWVWYSNAMLSRISNRLTLTKFRGFDEWRTFLFNELLCLVLILLVVSHMADISQARLLHTKTARWCWQLLHQFENVLGHYWDFDSSSRNYSINENLLDTVHRKGDTSHKSFFFCQYVVEASKDFYLLLPKQTSLIYITILEELPFLVTFSMSQSM